MPQSINKILVLNIIIDDNSNDGIIETINYQKKKNLKLYIRKKKPRDLSKSCTTGFLYSKFKNILVMDADLQHNPKYINKMILNFVKYKPDILVGCRKFNNRSKIKISYVRYILSKLIIYMFNKNRDLDNGIVKTLHWFHPSGYPTNYELNKAVELLHPEIGIKTPDLSQNYRILRDIFLDSKAGKLPYNSVSNFFVLGSC